MDPAWIIPAHVIEMRSKISVLFFRAVLLERKVDDVDAIQRGERVRSAHGCSDGKRTLAAFPHQ